MSWICHCTHMSAVGGGLFLRDALLTCRGRVLLMIMFWSPPRHWMRLSWGCVSVTISEANRFWELIMMVGVLVASMTRRRVWRVCGGSDRGMLPLFSNILEAVCFWDCQGHLTGISRASHEGWLG